MTQEPGSGGYKGSGSPGQLVSAMKILFVSHDEFLYILINQQILHCQLVNVVVIDNLHTGDRVVAFLSS